MLRIVVPYTSFIDDEWWVMIGPASEQGGGYEREKMTHLFKKNLLVGLQIADLRTVLT